MHHILETYMIKRRSLLKSGAAVAIAAPAITGFAQQTVTLKFHTFMAPQSNVWLNMHKAWMNKVEQESGGRIKFEAYPAMQLGGTPVQLYDQVRDGVVDVVWTLPGNTAGRFPRVEVFELPFIMTNAEATSKAYWEYVQTMAPDEFKETHLIALQVHGPGVIHTEKRGRLERLENARPNPTSDQIDGRSGSYSCWHAFARHSGCAV